MKKSKLVSLVLITAALASCNKPQPEYHKRFYIRGDSTAPYAEQRYDYVQNNGNTTVIYDHSGSDMLFWYLAFRPYGVYNYTTNTYVRSGYYSSAISERANVGMSAGKASVARGGFGGGRASVSS